MTAVALMALLVFVPMLFEAARAARHERAQFARGGVEPRGDVYRVMGVVYPLMFAVMLAEGAHNGLPARVLVGAGLAVFGVAKAMKWWAILALGPAWTFRVIVVPGARLVARGPYRYLRHPNYVGVAGEILGVAMMTGAVASGVGAAVVFGALLRKRLTVEEGALARSAAMLHSTDGPL